MRDSVETVTNSNAAACRFDIVLYPHPALFRIAEPITGITDDVRELAEGMIETMAAAPGLGLAAPQVGVSLRLVTLNPSYGEEGGAPAFTMVNPEITGREGELVDEEGCLSLPGIYVYLPRAERVKVAYTTLEGERREEWMAGLTARCVEHEMDHLDGALLWDRLGPLRRSWLKLKFYRLNGFGT